MEDTDQINFQKLRGEKGSSDEMTLDMLRSKGPVNEGQRALRRDISEGDYVNLGEDLPQNRL